MQIYLSRATFTALATLTTLGGVSALATGCAALNDMMGPPPPTYATQADVDAAVQAKDLAKLEAFCKGEGANKVAVMDAACTAGLHLLADQGNFERLDAICRGMERQKNDWRGQHQLACDLTNQRAAAAVLKASCQELPAVFEDQAKESRLLVGLDRKTFVKIGLKAAECDQWDFLIERLMHLGESGGLGEVMTRAVFEKYPQFEDKVLAYINAHMDSAGAFKHSDYAFDHYTTILNERHLFKNCAKYFPYAAKVPDKTWQMFNWYFRKAQCKGADKLAVKRLGSDLPSTRQGACKTLGLLGNKRKHLKLLERLAKSDPYAIIHNDTIPAWAEYPVRATCAKAANKLSLK